MTKDRLVELQAGHQKVEIRSGLNNGIEDANTTKQKKKDTEKKVLREQKKMEEMFQEANEVRQWIESLEQDVKSLKTLHTIAIHSARIDEDTKNKIMDTMVRIKTISLRAKGGLKSLEKRMGGKNTQVMARMVSVQHSTLLKRYQTVMTNYQNALVAYKERCESLIKTQLHIVIQRVTQRNVGSVPVGAKCETEEELDAFLDQENTQVFVNNYIRETNEAKQALQMARLRHNEILNLEKAIQEVRDLFIDMAILVQSQGEVIDRIEYNVEKGVDFVSDGTNDLDKGRRYKAKARKKKIWLIMCLVTVILVIIILATIKMTLDKIF